MNKSGFHSGLWRLHFATHMTGDEPVLFAVPGGANHREV